MSWTEVNFAEVNPGVDLIAEGDYTLRVLGGERNKYDQEAIDVKAAVVNEGPYCGQKVFFKFPNPAVAGKGVPASDPRNWVNKAFKRFEQAIGINIEPGEHPVEYLNRIALSDGRLDAKIKHSTYKNKDTGDDVTKTDVPLGSFRPASQ